MQTRKEFIECVGSAGLLFAMPSVGAAEKKQHVLISVDAKCCGTCQHWRGERQLVERGKRLRCEAMPSCGCMRGAGFKYPPRSSAASHGCITGGFYKQWVGLL